MSSSPKADRGLPSRHVTEGVNNALNRIFFPAMGLSHEDIERPIVGIAAAWDGSSASGKAPLESAAVAQGGVWAAGGMPRQFATLADDAGGDPTLVGRELIADSVELTVRGHSYDALIGVGSSVNGLAGLALAACRLDVPARLVALCDPQRGIGGSDTEALAAALRELGLALPAPRQRPSGFAALVDSSHAAGAPVLADLEAGRSPRDGVDAKSLADAAAAVASAGGDADLVVHLLAIGSECGVQASADGLFAAYDRASAHRVAWCRSEGLTAGGALLVADRDAPAIEATARVFDDPDAALGFARAGWPEGIALVVRGQGPRGGPGLRRLDVLRRDLAELDRPTGAILVTDGRLGPLDGVTCVTCVTPEAAVGGALAALSDGDPIAVDPVQAIVSAVPSGDPVPRPSAALSPALHKYAALVGDAAAGASTHPGAARERHRYADL